MLTKTSLLLRRQRSEQYNTRSHSRAHFLRQAKGLAQVLQIFCGKRALLCLANEYYPAFRLRRT